MVLTDLHGERHMTPLFNLLAFARVDVVGSESPLRTCPAARRRRPVGGCETFTIDCDGMGSIPAIPEARNVLLLLCHCHERFNEASLPGLPVRNPSRGLPPSPAPVAHWQSMILSTQVAGPGLGPAACWGSPASLRPRKGQ